MENEVSNEKYNITMGMDTCLVELQYKIMMIKIIMMNQVENLKPYINNENMYLRNSNENTARKSMTVS